MQIRCQIGAGTGMHICLVETTIKDHILEINLKCSLSTLKDKTFIKYIILKDLLLANRQEDH